MGCTKSIVWSIHHISSRHQKISLGHQHWSIGGRSDIRSDNTDFYKFLFSQTLGIFSIGRTQDIIPQGSKDSIRSNLQDWEKGAWMTHYHVSGFAASVLSAILCLETYTGPIWNCNCHLPLVSSWDISEPPSLGGSVRRA